MPGQVAGGADERVVVEHVEDAGDRDEDVVLADLGLELVARAGRGACCAGGCGCPRAPIRRHRVDRPALWRSGRGALWCACGSGRPGSGRAARSGAPWRVLAALRAVAVAVAVAAAAAAGSRRLPLGTGVGLALRRASVGCSLGLLCAPSASVCCVVGLTAPSASDCSGAATVAGWPRPASAGASAGTSASCGVRCSAAGASSAAGAAQRSRRCSWRGAGARLRGAWHGRGLERSLGLDGGVARRGLGGRLGLGSGLGLGAGARPQPERPRPCVGDGRSAAAGGSARRSRPERLQSRSASRPALRPRPGASRRRQFCRGLGDGLGMRRLRALRCARRECDGVDLGDGLHEFSLVKTEWICTNAQSQRVAGVCPRGPENSSDAGTAAERSDGAGDAPGVSQNCDGGQIHVLTWNPPRTPSLYHP